MNNWLHQFKSYCTYWLDAVDAHSLHSPFLYDFYKNTLYGNEYIQTPPAIEQYRLSHQRNHQRIAVVDYGAGSASGYGRERKISSIAARSLSARKYSMLYRRIINQYRCHEVIELGTSLGINTMYLATAADVRVTTFEGAPTIAAIARQLFEATGASNIQIVAGNIDETLPRHLQTMNTIDFAFVDANHRYLPTLRYLELLISKTNEKSVLVFDDIHYSPEMESAWSEIRQHPKIRTTVDLYRCGIAFLNPSLPSQHVVLQF